MLRQGGFGVKQAHGCPVDIGEHEDIVAVQHMCLDQVRSDTSNAAGERSIFCARDEPHTTVLVPWIQQTVCSCQTLFRPKNVVLDPLVVVLCLAVLQFFVQAIKLSTSMRAFISQRLNSDSWSSVASTLKFTISGTAAPLSLAVL